MSMTNAQKAEKARIWREKNKDRINKERRARYKNNEHLRIAAKERTANWRNKDPERAKELKKESYDRMKKLKGRPKNEAHTNWAGEHVGYHSLHAWVKRHKGASSCCDHCLSTSKKRYEWANIDHKYRRNLDDYIRLCTSCHRLHDYAKGLSKKGGRKKASSA